MKLMIAAIATATLSVVAAVSGFAFERQAAPIEPVCADSCDLAAHKAAMQRSAAMQHGTTTAGMVAGGMPGMSPGAMSDMPATPTPATPASPAGQAGSMSEMQMRGHMQMTPPRQASAADRARADKILQTLRTTMEPYKDYRIAEAAGYKKFLGNVQQPMYHFTSWQNAYANQFSFDPTRPTSLMYRPVPGGYELVGAMFTAPRDATLDQLDARVPLGVATWHLHTNLCIPPPGTNRGDMFGPGARFGLAGSIATQEECARAGGTFKPSIYNWMVHVWPYETDPSKIWADEEHPVASGH
jgi:hypothetical protein